MSKLDQLATQILKDVVNDFHKQNLGSESLNAQYIGVSMTSLETTYCTDGSYSKVDFDLALKQLEADKYVKTGPVVPFENSPESMVVVVALVSKREFVYLTEKGYRFANRETKAAVPRPSVHISGGNFHQSPIGVGGSVNQSLNSIDISSDAAVEKQLADLLQQHTGNCTVDDKQTIIELVNTAKTGDLVKVKPLFQRLFGTVKEGITQTAWGVITAYINAYLGL
jgi:hypothetical protein